TPPATGGERCFQEIEDFEDRSTPGFDSTGFASAVQDHWWRWAWTPVTTPTTNCQVQAKVYISGGATSTIVSDSFSIQPRLNYSKLIYDSINNITVQNGLQRDGQVSQHTTAVGGWYDANAENGENRAVSLLLSSFANLLRTRRSEMSTDEIHDLILQVVNGA